MLFICISNNIYSAKVKLLSKLNKKYLLKRGKRVSQCVHSSRPREKKGERTRGEQRAGKQVEQSLAHPTKTLTPEKLTHQRTTKDEREIKQRCVVLASLHPLSFYPLLCPHPSASPALLENKKHVKNLSKKWTTFHEKRDLVRCSGEEKAVTERVVGKKSRDRFVEIN